MRNDDLPADLGKPTGDASFIANIVTAGVLLGILGLLIWAGLVMTWAS